MEMSRFGLVTLTVGMKAAGGRRPRLRGLPMLSNGLVGRFGRNRPGAGANGE